MVPLPGARQRDCVDAAQRSYNKIRNPQGFLHSPRRAGRLSSSAEGPPQWQECPFELIPSGGNPTETRRVSFLFLLTFPPRRGIIPPMAMTERAAAAFVSENTAGGRNPGAVEAVDEEQRAVAPKPEERKRNEFPKVPCGPAIGSNGAGAEPSVESSRDGCVKA